MSFNNRLNIIFFFNSYTVKASFSIYSYHLSSLYILQGINYQIISAKNHVSNSYI